jgi:hypothetical protein
VIDQAKGIVMAHKRCDEDEAFEVLRMASQTRHRKLRDIAQDVVTATINEDQLPILESPSRLLTGPNPDSQPASRGRSSSDA